MSSYTCDKKSGVFGRSGGIVATFSGMPLICRNILEKCGGLRSLGPRLAAAP